ncbi:uncharacterized protein LOC133905238 [Phragmites australis]|uniref:uncharacterized protein LOC133905238 n=1 Tax=Phragmites australis TaxID=29695 RepID=UPI002D78CA1F|nr:uncharacterized protein LOC133905238 [Phragmites australis]
MRERRRRDSVCGPALRPRRPRRLWPWAPPRPAASGGADDSIRLYDLPTVVELCPLLDPSAAASALHLYDADGFELLATLRTFPRREAAEGPTVHPSGRVALAMLNLVTGRRRSYGKTSEEQTMMQVN